MEKIMLNSARWLPELVLFESYGHDWNAYLEVLYSIYKVDFLDSHPVFKNLKVMVKKLPVVNGKVSNFWHLIQTAYETKNECDRIPDFRRCERVRWPRPIIENHTDGSVLVWENCRHTKSGIQNNICLWLKENEYLVILRKRNGYVLFWTGYPVSEEHTKRKLEKEYNEANKKAGDAR